MGFNIMLIYFLIITTSVTLLGNEIVIDFWQWILNP